MQNHNFTDFDSYLVIANGNFVHRLALNNNSEPRLRTIYSGLHTGIGIDYLYRYTEYSIVNFVLYCHINNVMMITLYRQSYLFWSDYSDNIIWRSNLDGSQAIPIIETEQGGPGMSACHLRGCV